MAIRFIPNDPRAGSVASAGRIQAKRPNRLASRSGFVFTDPSPEGVAAPGTAQFLFWQMREAAIAALQAWEASAGPHKLWQGKHSRLPIFQNAGVDLNAYYDRASVSFFGQTVAGAEFFSAASTDVVAHEVGHGLLDSIRPDFFDVSYLEVGALHEAFGDCMALLTALNDLETRRQLLAAVPGLGKRNFVEATAEDLSRGIGLLIPGHNAALPRRAFNSHQYQLPSSLPSDGRPGVLINEVHSFGMVFSGCFWDLITNLFEASSRKTEATLLDAARLAGKILIAGLQSAVITPRFFQAVGRAMTLADQALHDGANHLPIRAAFARHNLQLGSNSLLAPSMALAGAAPSGARLTAATRKDLLQRFGNARGAKLALSEHDLFGTPVVNVVQTRAVALGTVDRRLKGVVALVHEPVLIGDSGGRAAVIGNMPHSADTNSEVYSFVGSLLARRRIDFGAVGKSSGQHRHATHSVRIQGGQRVLKRRRFSCFCHPV